MAFLVCAVVMAGATDAPLEQGRINQLSVYTGHLLITLIKQQSKLIRVGAVIPYATTGNHQLLYNPAL